MAEGAEGVDEAGTGGEAAVVDEENDIKGRAEREDTLEDIDALEAIDGLIVELDGEYTDEAFAYAGFSIVLD